MFNGNLQISPRQMHKCFFCATICPALFLLLYNYESINDFIISYAFTIVFSLLFLCIIKISNCLNRNFISKIVLYIFCLLFIAKYLLMIYLEISILFFTIYTCLGIPATNILFLITIFILCIYIAKSGIENIFRMSEILFIVLIIPIIALIFTTVSKIDSARLQNTIYSFRDFGFSLNILPRTLITTIIFFPIEICVTLKNHFSLSTKVSYIKAILKSQIIILSITLATAIIIIGIYGNISNKYSFHPLFTLMQLMSLGESMSVRLDFIIYTFVFISLFYSIGFYLYLLNHCIKTVFPKLKYGIFIFPMLSLLFVYLIFTPYKSKNPLFVYENSPDVVDNIYLNNENIIFEIHEYSNENTFFNSNEKNIHDAFSAYNKTHDNSLDFSHINAIYVSEKLYSDNEALKKALLQFKTESIFPETLKIKTTNKSQYKYLYSIYANTLNYNTNTLPTD